MNYYNYFTEIEEHFVMRRGKHLLVSPMDWGLIATWRDAGVPLQVAIRGIDIAMDGFFARQKPGGSKVSSLCYCHDAVMKEYADHLEAHVGEGREIDADSAEPDAEKGGAGDEFDVAEVDRLLAERIAEIRTLSTTQYPQGAPEGLQRVIERLEGIRSSLVESARIDAEGMERDLTIIDNLLTAELQAAITPEQMLEWEKEARKELKVYKKRLPKETFDKIRANALRDWIHRRFHIGELTLFRL